MADKENLIKQYILRWKEDNEMSQKVKACISTHINLFFSKT
jgi:hypothetical protein